jgi:Ca2+-binding RTX toxin-like protein
MTTTPTFWGSTLTLSVDGSAGRSSIAALNDGGFAVAYESSVGAFPSTEFNVQGRLISALGALVGGDILSDTSAGTTNDRYGPEAVQLDNGKLAVTFVREWSPTDFDPALALRDGPGYASGPTSSTLLDGSSADDRTLYETVRTDGGFATLFGRSQAGGADDLLLRRFDSSGSPLGSTIDLDSSTDSQSDADFDVLANGGIVAAWRTFNTATLTSTLWLRLFDGEGNATTGRFAFANTPNAAFAQVAALADGGFVAVWQDVSDGGIYHQRYDDRGLTQGARSFTPAGFSILPKVTALSDGGYVIGWSEFNGTEGDGSPDGSITLQRYGATGVRIGQKLVINQPGDQQLEDIQELADGRVVLTYLSETGDSTNVTNLLAQIIDPRDAQIEGTGDNDVIVGREDDSIIFGYAGSDTLTGRSGDDAIYGGGGADVIAGGSGDDELRGGSGGDALSGNAGDDYLVGGSDNDTLNGGSGADTLLGGSGTDFASYSGATAGVTADLQAPAGNLGDAAGDTYGSIENLVGSSSNDTLRGDAGANTLVGGAGADQLVGRSGDDILNGGLGADSLSGGPGLDAFVFDQTPGPANLDVIADFVAADDTIRIDNADFIGLAAGSLPASAFVANASGNPGDAGDRIIYENDTGKLYFDRDGTGATYAAVHFATLTGLPTIAAADFLVI